MSKISYHYIPRSIGEIMDHLGMMMLSSPRFQDKTGLLPGRSIDTVFTELNGGLEGIRVHIGEDRFEKLVAISARMRAHFEADPEDKTDDAIKGRELIHDMEDILQSVG